MRNDLFAHMGTFTYQEIDQIGTSTLITRMTSDINQVQNGVNMFLRLFLRSPFVVLGAVVMAFAVDRRTAVVFGGDDTGAVCSCVPDSSGQHAPVSESTEAAGRCTSKNERKSSGHPCDPCL